MIVLDLIIGTTCTGWAIGSEGKEIVNKGEYFFSSRDRFRILSENKKAPHCKARQGLNVFTTE
jgi:hypothetical protein